jgi:mevalonate kinase
MFCFNSAGLGSSAAFSVGSSTVCHLLRHLQSDHNQFVPNLDLINSWAFQCEKMFHATPSGIDNAVCTHGGVVQYRKTVIGSVSIPEARVLLVNTGVGRQTKLLVEAVRKRRDNFPAIIDHILDAIDKISCKLVEVIQQPSDANYSVIQVNCAIIVTYVVHPRR